jgi:uncharacterized membrane protein
MSEKILKVLVARLTSDEKEQRTKKKRHKKNNDNNEKCLSDILIILCECLFCFVYVSCGNEKGVALISNNCLSVIHIQENFLISVSNKNRFL